MRRPSVALAVGLSFLLGTGCHRAVSPPPGGAPTFVTQADSVEAIGESLRTSTSLETCRDVVRRLNALVISHPELKPPAYGPTATERLLLFDFPADCTAELSATTYTPLDAQHLHFCLLLRDAVRSLELDGRPPLEQAQLAFAWVCRQVRVVEPTSDRTTDSKQLLPPAFVVRRGWGTALERSVVFLALLEQLGLDGGLVSNSVPKVPAERSCVLTAVVIPGKPDTAPGSAVYLFDARLGLPVPAPDEPNRPATLAELVGQPESVLKQLRLDGAPAYDLTPAAARTVAFYPAWTSLSAFTPRMKQLQDQLWTTQHVRLALVPAHSWRVSSSAWFVPATSLRQFLPPPEGGTDTTSRRYLLIQRTMIPRDTLPPTLLAILVDLGDKSEFNRQLLHLVVKSFVNFALDDGQPRDLELHGRFAEANKVLVEALDEVRVQKSLASAEPDLDRRVESWWTQEAKPAFAEMVRREQAVVRGGNRDPGAAAELEAARGQLRSAWKPGDKLFRIAIDGAFAEARAAEVLYLLALAKHEQAERLQARAAHGHAVDGLEPAWRDACFWWGRFVDDHGTSPAASQARLLCARARLHLGDNAAAEQLLNDLTGDLGDLDKLARHYLVRRARAPQR